MKKLAFVFKGSRKEGFGHIARTFYISSNLDNHEISFFFKGDSEMLDRFKDKKIRVFENEPDLISVLKEQRPDWVIFDRQNNPSDTIDILRAEGIRTFLIEDSEIPPENTDILWDANIYQKKTVSNFFTGFQNFIVNPDIEKFRKKDISDKVTKIFICLGGTDVSENIPFLIENLHKDYFLYILPGIRYDDYLKYADVNVKILKSDEIYYRYAVESDIAIVSGGITMYEIVKMHIPALVWPQVSHQLKNAMQLEHEKLIYLIKNNRNIIKKIIDFAENHKERQHLFINMINNEVGKGFEKMKKILEDV